MLSWARKGASFLRTWRGETTYDDYSGYADAWAYVVHPTYKQAYKYIMETVSQVDEQPTVIMVEYDNMEHVLYWTENDTNPYDLHSWRMVALTHAEIIAVNEHGVMVTRSIIRRGRTAGQPAYTGR